MSIDGITSSDPYSTIASGVYQHSGAEQTIATSLQTQVTGSNQNLTNVETTSDALQIADGALDTIGDSLGRIRDLAIQASNGVLTQEDKSAIQQEISQLLEDIETTAKDTSFNTKPLLDGSFTQVHTAQNTDGSGTDISIASSTLTELGIDGFDVTGDFDISAIDSALDKVNESRSSIGSAVNAFEYASNSISGKINSITASLSEIQDVDIAEEISSLKKNQILDQYKMQMQKMRMENEEQKVGALADFKL